MNFKDLEIRRSYTSCGEKSIAASFVTPCLKIAKTYKRSVGFFSSGVFSSILDGIVKFSRNNGTIHLIASPHLSEEDIHAISEGYKAREAVISGAFSRDFTSEMEQFDDANLNLLAALIARGTLDIRIAVTESSGEYHDKLGILEDPDGNQIVFYGSANSSINGYKNNYEKIRVVRSWITGEDESVKDELEEFSALWNNQNPFVKVFDYNETAKNNLLQIVERRKNSNPAAAPITLRDYQEKAIKAWVENDYKGFYVMATGTGKTWTAIFSAIELLKKHSATIVICAPYKHLVKQWADDVKTVFPQARLILVSSENQSWDQQISQAIISKKYSKETQIIIISTIASFKMDRFSSVIEKDSSEKLLIVDEAHRFTCQLEKIKQDYRYLLGLSATPFSGSSAQKGIELMKFFGGQVFSLPIEEALERGYLVPYRYVPIFVQATSEEESTFHSYTKKILSCFNPAGVCINPDLLIKSKRGRLRVISMAAEKEIQLPSIITSIEAHDHFVVYCGDGTLFDNKTGEEIRHIQSVKRVLSSLGYKASQFTATENMAERMQLVDAFNNGEISALAAIRCLDEGINIPSITSALILSSNDDYREFVQRRGRILRKHGTKKIAAIYDIIVLPSLDTPGWAKIEFRRFYEYAKLSTNWDALEPLLYEKLSAYGMSLDDINVFEYDDVEDSIDE